jgi:hypothetical protein
MFPDKISKIVTALCALIGILALVAIGVLTFTGGSEFTEFALVWSSSCRFWLDLTGGLPFLSLLPPIVGIILGREKRGARNPPQYQA